VINRFAYAIIPEEERAWKFRIRIKATSDIVYQKKDNEPDIQ